LDNNSRVVFFLVSCIIVLGVSQFFIPAPPPAAVNPSNPVSQSGATVTNAAPMAADESSDSTALAKALPKAQALNIPAASVTIETDDYTAIFSNEGAALTSFQLKKYQNRQTHQPVELVNSDPAHPKPFSLLYSGLPLNAQRFTVEGSSKNLTQANEEAQLLFRYRNPQGLILEKHFTFKNGSYLIGTEITVSQAKPGSLEAGTLTVEWADTLGREEMTAGTNSRVQGYRVATLAGDHVYSESMKKSQEAAEIPSPITWTALANQFFMAALIPDPSSGGASVKVVRDNNAFKSPTPEDPNPGLDPKTFTPRPLLVFQTPELKQGQSFKEKFQVFLGPQDYSLLKSLGLQLERVIDLGTFGFISVYMLALLQWFFTLVHNWGLAVILLSVSVKLLLWLPTHNSYKNMYITQQKMREVQPKVDALKRKYPDDKQKQQQEQMKLFNEAGINPLGGCLPMLFQLPVFWALYATLNHSIELRGAHFLWLGDLTLHDPIYVLPFLMGGTMILQQKVSGQLATQAAGQQKMMMWMMPVVLTFISTKWPAGLLLYWVVTNILSMVQQKVVNREVQKAKKKVEVVKS
jgi:YidC/Oxa1 family membrane protein insertase